MRLKILNFEEGKTFLADESPVVNDKDYCEIDKTPSTLTYEVDGFGNHHVSGKGLTKEELISQAVKTTAFEVWFDEHCLDTFEEVGMDAPEIYDPEDNKRSIVKGIW